MSQPILWHDTETTGTDPKKNAIIQLSGIIESDGSLEAFDFLMRSHEGAEIQPDALEVNNRTVDEIMKFPDPRESIRHFKNLMSRYVNKFNRDDKFIAAGYNVGFDMDMLRATFERQGDVYFMSWFFWPVIDVKVKVAEYILKTGLRLKNYKLGTVCEHFEIEINAHDSMSDIQATRDLYYRLDRELKMQGMDGI